MHEQTRVTGDNTGPVHLVADRHDEKILGEQIDIARPVLDGSITFSRASPRSRTRARIFLIEKRVEYVIPPAIDPVLGTSFKDVAAKNPMTPATADLQVEQVEVDNGVVEEAAWIQMVQVVFGQQDPVPGRGVDRVLQNRPLGCNRASNRTRVSDGEARQRGNRSTNRSAIW